MTVRSAGARPGKRARQNELCPILSFFRLEHDPEKACPGHRSGVETGFPKKIMPYPITRAAIDSM